MGILCFKHWFMSEWNVMGWADRGKKESETCQWCWALSGAAAPAMAKEISELRDYIKRLDERITLLEGGSE